MRLLRLVPANTHIPFMRFHRICFVISGILAIASIVLASTVGFNYGIDFRGGTLIEIRHTQGPADLAELRSTLGELGLGEVQLQTFGAPEDVLINIATQPGGEEAQQAAVNRVTQAIGENYTMRRVEVVGPKVSGELIQSGVIAIVLSIAAILVYLWFRFEWQFGVGAVMATVHDIVLTIGLFSLLQLEFNLTIIAALLTIVGYSLNDTVVVYDRIREMLRKYKTMPIAELLDVAMNQTLSRTVLTAVTTLLAVLALYIFGGEVIRGFTLAIIWGVLVGTYSSAFIAAPFLVYLGVKRDWSRIGAEPAGGTAKAG